MSLLIDPLIILIAEDVLDDAQLVDAVVYKTNVVLARASKGLYRINYLHQTHFFTDGTAPAWFHAAMTTAMAPITERLDGINARLDGINARLDGINARLDGIDGRLTRIERTQAIVSTFLLVGFVSNIYSRYLIVRWLARRPATFLLRWI